MSTKQLTVKAYGIKANAIWGAVSLAALTALGYLLISQNVLAIGDFTGEEGPAGFFYVAAGCYLVGGLLILARRRWLWAIGAVINALVILFFVQMYINRPDVMFSPGGLVTKIAQICLEGFLIYIILRHGKKQVS